MKVDWKAPEDAQRLRELIAAERDAKQRDRFRVVLLAGSGLGDLPECEREFIAAAVGRSRQFVDQWVGRYRKEGLNALYPQKQPGAACKEALRPRKTWRPTTDRSCGRRSTGILESSTPSTAFTISCTAWATTI
jgi:hypothetical protein